MLRIDIWPVAREFLDSLSAKHRLQVTTKIIALAERPHSARFSVLEGFSPLCKLRSGDYRIIFLIDDGTLKVPLVDKRGDDRVYRRLKRLFG